MRTPNRACSSLIRLRIAAACALRSAAGASARSLSGNATSRPFSGCARPGLLQQIEERVPAGAIDRGVRILRGVAAGRVDQHGVLGEPPVAQPRAADAGDRALPHLLRQRETQAGVQQCRRLAGARRTDDRVPRLLVQIAAAARATSSADRARSVSRVRSACASSVCSVSSPAMPLRQRRVASQATQIQQRIAAAPGQQQCDDERERGGQSSKPGSNGAKNHARPASKAVPTKLMRPARGEDVGRRRH